MTRLPLALSGPFLMCVAFLGIKLVGGPILLWVGISVILWTLVLKWYLRTVENEITKHFEERAALELKEQQAPVGVTIQEELPLQSAPRSTSWERLDRVAQMFALWVAACLGWGTIGYSAATVIAGGEPSLEAHLAAFVAAFLLGSATALLLARWLSHTSE